MEYKFDGKITIEDYIQYNNHANTKSLSKKAKIILYIIVYGIMIYTILTALSMINNLGSNNFFIIFKNPMSIFFNGLLIVIIFFLIIFNKVYTAKMKIYYKKMYDSNKLMTEYRSYNVTADGINIRSENCNINFTKDKIYKIQYDNDSIYIFMGINAAYIIKRHFFKEEDDFIKLNDFIKENYESI